MSDEEASRTTGAEAAVRVDRWLWAARMFKTRSRASKACMAGHVKCNGTPAKAARAVRVGDEIEVITPSGRRMLEIARLGDKRGPASVAATLYRDHTPASPPEDGATKPRRERGSGRPTKRQRRVLGRLRGR